MDVSSERRAARGASIRALALAALAISLIVSSAAAQPSGGAVSPDARLLAGLRGGGFVVYFRHTDTDWSQRDARTGNFEDCASQRNLSDKGREHARAIGEAIRALGIPIGAVLASPLCRTMETATLAFGSAERSMAARDGGPEPPGSPDRFVALRGLLSTAPPPGTNGVIVSHGYPLYALVGGQYLDEGQAAVVRSDGTGFEVVARVGLKEWREMAERSR